MRPVKETANIKSLENYWEGLFLMSTSVLACGEPVEAEPVEAETNDEANAEEVSPQEHGRQSVLAWLKRTSFALSIGSASASAIAGSVLAQQAESAEEEVDEWIGDYDEPPANSAGDWTVSQHLRPTPFSSSPFSFLPPFSVLDALLFAVRCPNMYSLRYSVSKNAQVRAGRADAAKVQRAGSCDADSAEVPESSLLYGQMSSPEEGDDTRWALLSNYPPQPSLHQGSLHTTCQKVSSANCGLCEDG